MPLEQAVLRVQDLLKNDTELQRYIDSPKEQCEAAAARVSAKLRAAGIDHQVRGMAIWDKVSQEMPNNHFVVVAQVNGYRLCIDLTAHQFAGASQQTSAIIADERSWEEQFLAQEKCRNKAIKFKDFPSLAEAKRPLASVAEGPLLSDQDWSVLGGAPSWARDLIDYPGWGSESLLFQRSLSGPASTLPSAEQRALKEAELARRFSAEVKPFKDLESRINAGSYDIPTSLDTRQTLIEKAGVPEGTSYERILQQLDRYHAEASGLSLAQKVGRLGELALLADQYAASHMRNLNDRPARIQSFAESVRAYAIGLRRQDGALSDLGVPEAWRQPATESLAQAARNVAATDESLAYSRQLIVQLQGDDNSFQAAESLFGKHPRHSEWLQLHGDEPNSLGWNADSQSIQQAAPLQLDSEGRVRIVLVGHGLSQGGQTLFGGRTGAQLQEELATLLQRFPTGKVKGIHLDLVGCRLMDGSRALAETLPGQLGEWLLTQGTNMGIERSSLSLSAREYPVRVTASGRKEVLTEEWGWIGKESARLRDVLHKVELVWDAQAGRLVRKPLSQEALSEVGLALEGNLERPMTTTGLLELGRALEDAAQRSGLSEQERNGLADLHVSVGDALRRHLFDREAPAAEHRTIVEQSTVKNARIAALGAQWAETVEAMQREAGLSPEAWLPTLKTRSLGDGATELLFVNRSVQLGSADGRRWVRSSAAVLTQFEAEAASMVRDLQRGVGWAGSRGLLMWQGLSEPAAVHTLNAAYMLQTLMDVNPRNGGLGAMSDALKVQVYAQLINNGLSTAVDAAHMADWVGSALQKDLTLLSKTGQIMGVIGGSAGAVLDGINIGAIIVELMQTTDPTARVAVETKLSLAVVNSGVSLAALLAGMAGAGGAATVLGALATPLAGLSVGIPVLVDNYQRLRNGFDQSAQRFNDILASIQHRGLQQSGQTWQVADGAVVEHLDFVNGTMRYGSIEVNGTRGGSGHTVTGGWDHFFARPDPDSHTWLDVYAGLGMADKQYVFKSDGQATVERIVTLPSGVGRRIQFDYNQVTGRRSADVAAFRRLHEHYGDQFIWGMYAFPTDWGISSIVEEPRATAVRVTLDAESRTLIVPTVTNAVERGHLSYDLQGHGGVYSVVLPAEAVPIRVEASGERREKWVFDLDYAVKTHSVQDGKLVLGALKHGAFSDMRISANAIVVGGQTLSFAGEDRPQSVLLTHTLGEGATLCLSVDLEAGCYASSLILEREPSAQMTELLQRFYTEANTPGLSDHGWLSLAVGQRSGAIHAASGDAFLLESGSGETTVWQLQQGQTSQWSLPGVAIADGRTLSGTLNLEALSANFSGIWLGDQLQLRELDILAHQDVETHVMDGLLRRFSEQGMTRGAMSAWLTQQLGEQEHIGLSQELRVQGRDAFGRRLSYRLASGDDIVMLDQAAWEVNGVNYIYREGPGGRRLEIIGGVGQDTLETLAEDIVIPGMPAGVEIMMRPSETTHWLRPGAMALSRADIAIITDDLPNTPIHLVLPGTRGAYRWQLDGADLLLVNGAHHVKLLNMVGSGREGRLSSLSFSFEDGEAEAWSGNEVFQRLSQVVPAGELSSRSVKASQSLYEMNEFSVPSELTVLRNQQRLVQAMNSMAPVSGSDLTGFGRDMPDGLRPLLTQIL
ncbi:TcdA/TcdB pore-forming domain-containing protein [Chromobacterium sp. ASV23]|uniref:TcdA/TcdB pore-forming domain-containing protein n=1 Tax=Chromobacterium sp. ASV23 TaxID=2795110 RepID=UPI0018EDB5C1|nr:TcdA/TcdB pore-forming domain-containing protein [Chromobacterium sp. ASV23]